MTLSVSSVTRNPTEDADGEVAARLDIGLARGGAARLGAWQSAGARLCYLPCFFVGLQSFGSLHAFRTDAMYRSPTLTCPASAWLTIV
jgi:hypothetical protein